MKLSIIIPTYNRINLLLNLINDLLTQTENNFEVLIIDDYSTDDTENLINKLIKTEKKIKYLKNNWKWQRDWKKTWLKYSKWEFICFLDDDIKINDINLIKKILNKIDNKTVLQPKIIMLDKWEKNIKKEYFFNKFLNISLPILELLNFRKNYWSKELKMFPFIEFWVFFHKSIKEYFIDNNLIVDWYWESYSSWIKLINNNYSIIFFPETEIYHLWSNIWWSKKFDKKNMLIWFTEFHYWYFYNMVYIHSRFKPFWIFLWLPFYFLKSTIAVIINRDIKWFINYAIKPIFKSLYFNFIKRKFIK